MCNTKRQKAVRRVPFYFFLNPTIKVCLFKLTNLAVSDLHCGYRILLQHIDMYSCGTGFSVFEVCWLSSGSVWTLLPCTKCEILVPWVGIKCTSPEFHQGSPLVVWLGHYLQFSLVACCVWLCNPMDCSTPGLPVHHQLLEFTQIHVHWVGGGAIQPSHPLLSPSPPTFNLSQQQGLFKWVSSLYQVAEVLEFQLQHQSFQWIFRTDFL